MRFKAAITSMIDVLVLLDFMRCVSWEMSPDKVESVLSSPGDVRVPGEWREVEGVCALGAL